MKRCAGLLLLLLVAAPTMGARQNETAPAEEKGTYLGVLFCPIPEALLEHLPQLPREGGVMVTHVLSRSPADKAGLRKHDILLRYDEEAIRNGDHLARLIRSSKDKQEISLSLVRGGRELKVPVKLELGPVLQIASESRKEPPGTAKPGAPAAVSVTAVPMDGNRLKVTFEYSDAGKFRTVICSGDAEQIDNQIERLPLRVQTFARFAVKRLRDLELQKAPTPSSGTSRPPSR
ncbi:MAG TPA: PDZ domain-containing protein [Gemmataceae bacterium]|nr:PDZ domain-containing protein [Gemmataceae bacterium]